MPKLLRTSLSLLIMIICLGCTAGPLPEATRLRNTSTPYPLATKVPVPTLIPTATVTSVSTLPVVSTTVASTATAQVFVAPDFGKVYTQTAQAKLTALALTPVATRTPWPSSAPALRDLAAKHGLYIGAAVQAGLLAKEPAYSDTAARQFNLIVPEYEMKMCIIWPARDRFDFSASDAIVQFAVDHQQRLRGHNLVWTDCLPDWISQGHFSQADATAMLKQYISAVVGHYRGKIQYWDVLNETIDRPPVWQSLIGPDYETLALTWAHAADPDALLFYNDYDAEVMNNKADRIYAMVKAWRAAGVPIHGVGLQAHLKGPIDYASLAQNIARLNALGLQVHITELDLPQDDFAPAQDEMQGQVYANVLKVCLAAKNCPVFVFWGFTDKYSYLNQNTQVFPLIFDQDYKPKPAYAAIYQVLGGK